MQLVYGSPFTLTDSGVKISRTAQPATRGDLIVMKPNILMFAPLVLQKIYDGLMLKLGAGLKGKLFRGGVRFIACIYHSAL